MSRYQVVGPNVVFGHQPGTLFEQDIPAAQEARLIKAGHIALAPNVTAKRRRTAKTTPRKAEGNE